jgi:hypothetical protein
MRWLLVVVGWLAACGDNVAPEVVVYAPDQLAPGAGDAVEDLVHDLAVLTGQPVQRASPPAPGCRDLALRVVVLGHEHDGSGARATTPLAGEEYTIDEVRCARGHTVTLRGGSLLAGQWAIYDFLERLGVRRFHPERTVIPGAPQWPAEPLAVDARPSLRAARCTRTRRTRSSCRPGWDASTTSRRRARRDRGRACDRDGARGGVSLPGGADDRRGRGGHAGGDREPHDVSVPLPVARASHVLLAAPRRPARGDDRRRSVARDGERSHPAPGHAAHRGALGRPGDGARGRLGRRHDGQSARAATLGYTVATLPARIAFRIEATGRERGATVSGARGRRRRR